LSRAVVTRAFAHLANLADKLQNGTARATDAAAALTATNILFDHFDEVGLANSIQATILANRDAIVNYQPTADDVLAVQSRYKSLGVNLTINEINARFTLSHDKRATAIDLIATQGLTGLRTRAVAQLQSLQTKLTKMEQTGNKYPLLKVQSGCDDYDLVAAAMGVGCAFGCLGCCVVAAVAELFAVICRMTGGLV